MDKMRLVIIVVLSMAALTLGDTVVPVSQPCRNETRADIVFLLDASKSIGARNWEKEVHYVSQFVKSFNSATDDVRFAAVVFNKVSNKLFDLKTHLNPDSVANAVASIPYPDTSGTNTHLALAQVRSEKMFSLMSGGRYVAKDAVIVLTDGRSGSPALTVDEVKLLKSTGVTIITVGIGHINKEELTTLSTKPESIFTVDDLRLVDYVKREFSRLVCDVEHMDKLSQLDQI